MGPAAEVRTARPGEVDAVVRAYEWLFAAPGVRPPHWDPARAAARVSAALESAAAEVLVAAPPDGGLLGLCTVYLDLESVRFGPRAWVEDLAVHPAHRSHGLGRRLLEAAQAWARARGATHLKLESAEARVDAHRFYERERPSTRAACFGWEL